MLNYHKKDRMRRCLCLKEKLVLLFLKIKCVCVSIIFILNAHVSDNSLSELQCLNKNMLTAPLYIFLVTHHTTKRAVKSRETVIFLSIQSEIFSSFLTFVLNWLYDAMAPVWLIYANIVCVMPFLLRQRLN